MLFHTLRDGEQFNKLVPIRVFLRVDGKKRYRDRLVPGAQPCLRG
jgi:hypothetical protein